MLGIVLAMAMFFSQIEHSEDFVCVPEAVFAPEFFLVDDEKEKRTVVDICYSLDFLWDDAKEAYSKKKDTNTITDQEYCVLNALMLYAKYREWYCTEDEGLMPMYHTPYGFYRQICENLSPESIFFTPKYIKESLDNYVE